MLAKRQSAEQVPKTLPRSLIDFFFVLGLFSALMFRILIVFQHWHPEWFRPVWYAGILGYTVFFGFRFYIARKRKLAISSFDLITKVRSAAALTDPERDAVVYLLSSIEKSRENLNYLFIFALSGLAVFLDLAMTMGGAG